jgi:hypothetical protein
MLGCCIRTRRRALTKVSECPPAAVEKSTDDAASWYKQRPERTGMWFIAHQSTADELRDSLDLQEAPINIWDEFFSMHPVGDVYCKNFVALQLSEESLYRNREKIRCASYRWEDVKGVGVDNKEYQAPSNYMWFLKWIERHNVLGWMDFTANIVVNVSGRDTVGYMGSLYADFITVSHWMEDSMRLQKALGRGWIFQETAFGAFDSTGITFVLDEMRELGLSTLASSESSSSLSLTQRSRLCVRFCEKAEHLSKLLDRRGYYALAQVSDILCNRQYEYYNQLGPYAMSSNVAHLLVQRAFGHNLDDEDHEEMKYELTLKLNEIVEAGEHVGYTAMFHLCDIFTDSEESEVFRQTYQLMHKLLTEKSWEQASTVEEFFEKIGDPLMAAYSSLEVSYETDREDAVSRVARSIIRTSYAEELDYSKFSQQIWEGAARICLKTDGMIGTTVLRFPPSIRSGMRFIGGISVSGARLDGDGSYMAREEGRVNCQWALSCVSMYTLPFQWQESTSTWILPSDDKDHRGEDSEEEQYDLFLCSPPEGTDFFCGYVARLASGDRRPTHAQFFTDQNPPYFPDPAPECVFS